MPGISLLPLSRFAVAALVLTAAASCSGASGPAGDCGEPGQWLIATKAGVAPTGAAPLLDRMAAQQAVLLGEAHDSAEDHRWQLHVLAQLHSRRPQLAIGFEMFPRRLQPVLDQWVAGTLSEAEFLKRSEWDKVWVYDARDYLPLFHYARMNRIPMLALNVERSLVEAVGRQGWDAVPAAQKEGVSRPAAPTPEYRKTLRTVFDHHPAKQRGEETFPRYVEAQTVWDRAMAQPIADHLKKQPGALVVAILGVGHVRHGHGVAHQLKDLGVARVGALLTWDQADACAGIVPGLADAVYVVKAPAANPPRLGVAMEPAKEGIRIASVQAGSVAEQAGLKGGDIIVTAAGQPAKIDALRALVQRQPPGTWLPLKVKRGTEEIEIVARFPAQP
ncbi:ChaN family lipoprotein [Sulfurisoma sediminicola]|nr:ChaN family lipoprotein [Sulfurisoma sediminicola]